MLLKLLKYDLKFIFKPLSIFMLILVVSAVLHNITAHDYNYAGTPEDPSFGRPNASVAILILHTIFYNLVIVALINLIINCCTRIWQRFRRNFYSDEGYLTHTLPVARRTLWLSKFIAALVTIAATIGIIGGSFALLSLTNTGKGLVEFFGLVEAQSSSYYITYALTVFTQITFISLCGLSGIAIGRRRENHRTLWSVLSGLGIYLCGALILVAILFILSNFDTAVHDLIFGAANNVDPSTIFNTNFIVHILRITAILYIVMITILYFVDQKILKKGINLE